jgi:cephalosporin-C deacetylase
MPQLDMPLDKLKTYEGRNPRPADFDAYWSKALAELDATPAKATTTPAPFTFPGVEAHDLWFTGVGGARIHAKLLKPAQAAGKRPAVVLFHGYSGSSGEWLDKLAWVAQGYVVAALDCRGQGGLSEDNGAITGTTQNGHIIRGLADHPDKLLFRSIYLDTAQLARVVLAMSDVDASRVHAHGGSQGGALTIACAALEPRIRKAAPVFPFLCDYKRVWEMDQAQNAYAELKTFFRHFDPRHEREDDIFTRLGYIDLQFLAPRIKADILMGVGLMDNICPPSTQFAAFNKMTCRKDTVIYPDFGHEGLPGFPDRVAAFFAS